MRPDAAVVHTDIGVVVLEEATDVEKDVPVVLRKLLDHANHLLVSLCIQGFIVVLLRNHRVLQGAQPVLHDGTDQIGIQQGVEGVVITLKNERNQ